MIGGADKYMAACRSCHLKKVSYNNEENEKTTIENKKAVKNKRGILEPLDVNINAKKIKVLKQ